MVYALHIRRSENVNRQRFTTVGPQGRDVMQGNLDIDLFPALALKPALARAGIVLEALNGSVKWELAPAIMDEIAGEVGTGTGNNG